MNNRMKNFLACCFVMLAVSSCFKHPDPPAESYVDTEYSEYYRISSLRVTNGAKCLVINPALRIASEAEKGEIKTYYGEKTRYTGRQYYIIRYMNFSYSYSPISMWAIDWRILDIDIITEADWDSTHPVGSSVRDLFSVRYRLNDALVEIPLSKFTADSWSLTDYCRDDSDYYPAILDGVPVTLFVPIETGQLSLSEKSLSVHIIDAFGNKYDCEVEK